MIGAPFTALSVSRVMFAPRSGWGDMQSYKASYRNAFRPSQTLHERKGKNMLNGVLRRGF